MNSDNSNSINSNNIPVILIGEWKEYTKTSFTKLLEELISFSSSKDRNFLGAIYISPQEHILTIVNTIIKISDVTGNYKPPEKFMPKGMAIPIQNNKELTCYIVLDSILLESIENNNLYHPKELVSTLLEELLHVQLYGLRWEKLKLIFDDSICQEDLFRLCSGFHDEFAAGYLKAEIIASQKLIDYDGELTTGSFAYGESIASGLNNAQKNLADLVIGAVDRNISIQDAFKEIITQTYRNIFEPLSRDAGFRFANPNILHPNSDADSNWFYREHIKPFWLKIEIILQDSMKSNFDKYDIVIYELVSVVDDFLKYIGIFIKENDDGSCHVDFDTGFFDSIAGRNYYLPA